MDSLTLTLGIALVVLFILFIIVLSIAVRQNFPTTNNTTVGPPFLPQRDSFNIERDLFRIKVLQDYAKVYDADGFPDLAAECRAEIKEIARKALGK